MFSPLPNRRIFVGSTALSVAAHTIAVGVLFFSLRLHPVHVFSLPGTASGSRVELTYLPGKAPAPLLPPRMRARPRTLAPPSVSISSPPSAAPDSTSGSDSWGSGSTQIALTTYSPSPAPDLSALPRGVQGDVVIDVTIDPSGKVADLAVLHTIGYGIETNVIGTLRTWTFRPATKDGTPIASVQELHFHFGPV